MRRRIFGSSIGVFVKLVADDQSDLGGWKSGIIKGASGVPLCVASSTRLRASCRSALAMSLAGHAHLNGLCRPIVRIFPAVACPIMCLPDRSRDDLCRCRGRTTADTKRFQKHAKAEMKILLLDIAFEIIVITDGFRGIA